MRLRIRLALAALAVGMLIAPGAQAVVTFTQPLWFTWSKANFLVYVVPPEHGQVFNDNLLLNNLKPSEEVPCTSSYTVAINESIKDWDRAINAYGSTALKAGLHIKHYVIGCETVPQADIRKPDIIVTTDEDKTFILGVAVRTAQACIVDNSKFLITSMTYQDMFNINAQEYGHCLGLDHVGGGTDGPNGDKHDPMNGLYPHDPGSLDGIDLHCVSNLNVKGLENVFNGPLGTGTTAAQVTMPQTSYIRLASCGPTPV